MTTLLDKDDFEQELQRLAIRAIDQAGIGNRSGKLRNTLRVIDDPDGYILEFEPYGLYVDSGVKGTLGGITGRGYEGKLFQFSGRYKMIGGNLGGRGPAGYAIRTSIYKYGLAAKPWIQKALDLITEGGADLIEAAAVKKIEEYVSQTFPRTAVQITL